MIVAEKLPLGVATVARVRPVPGGPDKGTAVGFGLGLGVTVTAGVGVGVFVGSGVIEGIGELVGTRVGEGLNSITAEVWVGGVDCRIRELRVTKDKAKAEMTTIDSTAEAGRKFITLNDTG